MIFTPFTEEWRYRITPAPGFKLRELPKDEKISASGTEITRNFVQENGVVTATLRISTGQQRLTAAEAEELRTKILAWRKADAILVYFDQAGEKLLQAGDVKGALVEFRKLAQANPKNALHRSRIARALLAAGFGDSARREARAATGLDPKSYEAWIALGTVLQHDAIGRFREKDMGNRPIDTKAALAQAKEFDKAGLIAADYAILLEHNAQAERYGTGAKLDDAIAEYRAMGQEKMDQANLPDNLGFALWRAGHVDALLEHLGATKGATPSRHSLKLAALAVKNGPAAAIEESSRLGLNAQSRAQVLTGASQQLLMTRRYKEAGEMMGAAAKGNANAAQGLALADALARAQKLEQITGTDPESILKRFMHAIASLGEAQPGGDKQLLALFTSPVRNRIEKEPDFQRDAAKGFRQNANRGEMPSAVAMDLGLALSRFQREGSDEIGYRLRTEAPGAKSGAGGLSSYLQREEGAWKLADLPGASMAGYEVLRMVSAGKLDAARQWLDWMREGVSAGDADDPLSGSPFARLWKKGSAAGAARMRLAAAAHLAGVVGSELDLEAAGILEAALKGASETERDAIENALCAGKDFTRIAPIAERLIARHPESDVAFQKLITVYGNLKRWPAANELATKRLARLPNDHLALATQINIACEQQDFDRAEALSKKLVDLGKATASDLNTWAWIAVVRGQITPASLETARRAASESQNSPAVLHTMAAAYALEGKTAEARQVLLQTIAAWKLEEPNAAVWLVCGMMAEQFGLNDEAKSAYEKASEGEKSESVLGSGSLARKRLAGLVPEKPAARP